MSLFVIKIIALSSMFFDHFGVFLFPGNIYFRLVGRLSFPLFAWAIANGTYFTKNINKYLIRVLALAIISQIPYELLFRSYGVDKPGLNILFTLALGILCIILLKKFNLLLIRVIIVLSVSLFAILIHADYEAFGVLTIIVFFVNFNNPVKYSILFTILVILFYLFPVVIDKYLGGTFDISNINILEVFSPLSLPIIAFYNKKKGYDLKYLFYIFYPVHLIVIYSLALYLF